MRTNNQERDQLIGGHWPDTLPRDSEEGVAFFRIRGYGGWRLYIRGENIFMSDLPEGEVDGQLVRSKW